ncbi:MAG TPA: alkaline phosphatase family protein [Terriglobales bacterium]|nr:alkaline phosphatase family protein [Terriglobales bacterium]
MSLQPHRPHRLVFLWFLLIIGVAASAQAPRPISDLQPTLILISIDGFRYDYLDKYSPPNLQRLAATGVRAAAMQPSFPTYTFPNHYTIVTGLYPAHHGIVANEIYDPGFDTTFVYKEPTATEARWWGGEPIWVTAQKQGQKTASLYWPGSAAPIEGVRPDYWEPFDAKVAPDQRADKILGWLDLPAEQRPTFLALYFDQVDHEGHEGGPDSPQVRDAITKVDAAIGRLVDGLRQRGIEDRVNIIVVSDHGMAPTPPKQAIFIDDYIDLGRVRVVTRGQLFTLWPAKGETGVICTQLRKLPHARVYRREKVPARWHYSGNARIAPIMLLADEGWTITDREYARSHELKQGGHGYDNNLRSMQAAFIAHGPAFKAGTKLPAFPNVDVYELMAYLLHLKPARNDGTLKVFRPVLAGNQ